MTIPAPLLDKRTAPDVVAQLVLLLEQDTSPPTSLVNPYSFSPWREYDLTTLQPTGVSAALIGVFARFAELVIERLNQVPDKNFRAFLDLLGAARLPPEPARVPLTFSLAAGRIDDAVVPAGTKVAAQPAEGDTEPVIFEVEQALVVTATQLTSLVTLDPEQDTYSDWSGRDPVTAAPFTAFEGEHQIEHVLYIGDDRLLAYLRIQDLQVAVTLEESLVTAEPREIEWERWDGTEWVALVPGGATQDVPKLTQSGTISFGGIEPVPQGTVDSRTSRWIRARLLTPVTLSDTPVSGMVRADKLPTLGALTVAVNVVQDIGEDKGLVADSGFTNGSPLDLTKEFFPFGERPKLFDSLYLSNQEAFTKDPTSTLASDPDAVVSLDVKVANPFGIEAPNTVNPSTDLELVWECSTLNGWKEVGRSHPPTKANENPPAPDEETGFADGTYAFCQDGVVTLKLPDDCAKATVSGQENHWLRVRIVKGDYGQEAKYVKIVPEQGDPYYEFTPATFSPPIVSSLKIGYKFTARRSPEISLTYNDLNFKDVTTLAVGGDVAFEPFKSDLELERPGLFLGFTLPAKKTSFPNNTISLYTSLAAPKYGERLVPLSPDMTAGADAPGSVVKHRFVVTNSGTEEETFYITLLGHSWPTLSPPSIVVPPGEEREFEFQVTIPLDSDPGDEDRGFLHVRAGSEPSDTMHAATFLTAASLLPSTATPKLAWQYWNGTGWSKIAVRDDSESFSRSGLVEFLAPRDFSQTTLFGRQCYWLRVLWEEGDYSVQPRLRQMLLNTTTAVQSLTTTNEILGSSNGGKDQTFQSTRFPVIEGQSLEVREPELPSAEEQEQLEEEEGDDAIKVVYDAAGRPREIWVRWHEVPDFYASGPRDRHYVMDHLSGEIRFGDGLSGRIPPIGASNLRLARYQSGSGASGNRAAGTVTQLKTTVPYIEKVTNPEAAAGGAEAEPLEVLYERMPRTLRHRDRAVTSEDYEDLAALASPEVARSLCVPLRDLGADPLGDTPRYGMVSVIVVPRTSDAKPQPTLELLDRVQSHLEERTPADAGLAVVGPLYVRVDVRTEIAVASVGDAREVERAVQERLAAFLHPLTGGLDEKGWDFGRAPHRSDFLALIEGVEGVDHVRFLQIEQTEDLKGVRETGRFLVYSGHHQVALVFEET